MKLFKFLFLITISLTTFVIEGKSQVNPSNTYVSGYTRSDGTYVNGYYKTIPNNSNRDNYTTKPNINPYTGTSGYIQPDDKSLNTKSEYSIPSNSPYSAPISTGSRGGQYYINSNGNKTYIKKY